MQICMSAVGVFSYQSAIMLFLISSNSLQVTKEDIKQEVQKVTEGVVDVIVYPSAADKTKNRG